MCANDSKLGQNLDMQISKPANLNTTVVSNRTEKRLRHVVSQHQQPIIHFGGPNVSTMTSSHTTAQNIGNMYSPVNKDTLLVAQLTNYNKCHHSHATFAAKSTKIKCK